MTTLGKAISIGLLGLLIWVTFTFGQSQSRDVPSITDLKILYADCKLVSNSQEKDVTLLVQQVQVLQKELDALKNPKKDEKK